MPASGSPTAQFFGIASLDEARAYLAHPVLGSRLRQSVDALRRWAGERTAEQILGSIDAIKLKSSITLFGQVEPDGTFHQLLTDFYRSEPDERTLALLNAER